MQNRRSAMIGMAATAAGAIAPPVLAHANARPPLQASPPFELTTHMGKRIRSDRDFDGRPMIVYFGYTFCPDYCPSALTLLAAALAELEGAGAAPEGLGFIFISIDPARDTPEKLADYVAHFHPKLIGATGSQEEIASLAKGWNVKYGRSKGSSGEDYLMDHPIYGFGLNRRHQVASYLWHYAPVSKLAKKIRELDG